MTGHQGIVLGALTWNLFHGRDHPPDPALFTWRSRLLRLTEVNATHAQVNRPLLSEFAGLLDSWRWEVALLQEAPPRWLDPLCRHCRADGALGLTSRNELAPLRAALADLNPDLVASNDGGSNMVLVRAPARIVEVHRVELVRKPERRALLLARVDEPGGRRLTLACMHLSRDSTQHGPDEALHAAREAVDFAGAEPLIFGGDLNFRPARDHEAFEDLRERFGLAAPTSAQAIDHVLARGLDVVEPAHALEPEGREVPGPAGLRLRLSDHAPVTAAFGMR